MELNKLHNIQTHIDSPVRISISRAFDISSKSV